MIRRVEIENFLCFKSAVVNLRRFNVLIGENGAGKSAFIEALAFAADVERLDLRTALFQHGGIEVLRWRGAPDGTSLRVTVNSDQGSNLRDIYENFRILDVDVHAACRPAMRYSGEKLLSYASNLAAVLDHLRDNEPGKFQAIERDMASILPSFNGIDIREIPHDEEMVEVRIREKGLPGSTPLIAASSGTIRALAIFTFLQEQNNLACIEGIERDLQPSAFRRIVERLREASQRTQFIVTTQAPAILAYVKAEDLIVFKRDEKTGCTSAFSGVVD